MNKAVLGMTIAMCLSSEIALAQVAKGMKQCCDGGVEPWALGH
jgi:hypothetical protein